MPVKYIGAVLIFIACSGFGFTMAANYRKEVSFLSDLIRILETMQSELEYRLTPLPQICEKAAEQASGALKSVFTALKEELEAQDAQDATECMRRALKSVKDIPEKTQNALKILGSSLGMFDLDGQTKEISAVIRQIGAQLNQLQQDQDTRLRSYRTLGLCLGAGLAILFL